MQNPKYKAYKKLKELQEKIEITNISRMKAEELEDWKQDVISALSYLSENSIYYRDFTGINLHKPGFFSGLNAVSDFNENVNTAKSIIRKVLENYEEYEHDSSEHANTLTRPIKSNNNMTRKIFIVHGHDDGMKQTVARFVEKLDFEPIILHEQANKGGTIIEKFEDHSDVSYAVILLSPDDVGAANDAQPELQPRARQNVILELGFFIGKLGRPRVFPLRRESVEMPSDISGVMYTCFDNENWEKRLVQELKVLGFDIDANKIY